MNSFSLLFSLPHEVKRSVNSLPGSRNQSMSKVSAPFCPSLPHKSCCTYNVFFLSLSLFLSQPGMNLDSRTQAHQIHRRGGRQREEGRFSGDGKDFSLLSFALLLLVREHTFRSSPYACMTRYVSVWCPCECALMHVPLLYNYNALCVAPFSHIIIYRSLIASAAICSASRNTHCVSHSIRGPCPSLRLGEAPRLKCSADKREGERWDEGMELGIKV